MAFGDYVQSAVSTLTTSTSHTVVINGVTAGNSLIVYARHGNSTGDFTHLTSVADDKNAGNYTVDAEQAGGTADALVVARKSNVASGNTTITITYGVSGSIRFAVHEYEGNLDLDEKAQTGFTSGAGTTITTDPVTPDSTDRTLLFGAIMTDSSATFDPHTSETERTTLEGDRGQGQDIVVTTTTPTSVSWTLNAARNGAHVIAAYKAAVVGGAGSILPLVACDIANIGDMRGMRG